MKNPLPALVFLSFSTATVLAQTTLPLAGNATDSSGNKLNSPVEINYGKLPLSFEANQGQTNPKVKFLSRGLGYSLFLTDTTAVLSLTQGESPKPRAQDLKNLAKDGGAPKLKTTDVVRMELVGASTDPRVEGADQLPGRANYFTGKDPSKWRTGVPTYARVKYTGVYPGVDLVYYGNQRQLEYDFLLAPGADPKPVRLHFEGVDQLRIEGDGSLAIKIKTGEIAFRTPEIYQMKDGRRQRIDGGFTILSQNTVGFRLGEYDHSRELVIDPVLAYTNQFGGGAADITALAVDGNGYAYIAGTEYSATFPTTSGAYLSSSSSNQGDVFVAKLNPAGSAAIYSTLIGSAYPRSLAIDNEGNAYIAGTAGGGTGFPTTTGAFLTANMCAANASPCDGFVTKLNPTGSALVYSTYLGGGSTIGGQYNEGLAVDHSGNAYVGGSTNSPDFPVTAGALQSACTVTPADYCGTGYLSELNPTGTGLVFSTFLGGTQMAVVTAVAVDSAGSVYVAGTAGYDLPVTLGAFQQANREYAPTGFVAKIKPGGTAFDYVTYLGGSLAGGGDWPWADICNAIAVDPSGDAYVTGLTQSETFPVTPGAFQPVSRFGTDSSGASYGGSNAFVTKLNPAGSGLVYSTYLGGNSAGSEPGNLDSAGDEGYGIAVDSAANAYVTGVTPSTNFPVTSNAYQGTNPSGGFPAFFTEVNADGTALLYSTYFAGGGGSAISLDSSGDAYIAGGAAVSKFSFGSPTTTTLATSASPQVADANVNLTATVTPTSGTGTPSGSVDFFVNGVFAATIALDSGQAVYSTSALPVGVNLVAAIYEGYQSQYAPSSGSSATQTIQGDLASPVISPPGGNFSSIYGGGEYSSAQLVTITAGAGAKIYYTLDGSTPTTASAVYTQPFPLQISATVKAIAVLAGDIPSAVASATFTLASTIAVPFGAGFSSALPALQLNGSAQIVGSGIQLTDGLENQAGSFFTKTPVNIDAFSTDFTFQITNPVADGFTFTLQNTGPTALGGAQAGLGYVGIHQSLAIKFDLYDNAGEGSDSIGIFTAGNLPTVPAVDMTGSGIDLHSGDPIHVFITYMPYTLTITLVDLKTGKSFNYGTDNVYIRNDVHGDTAYAGFTGGTGSGTSTQTISSWTYVEGYPVPPNFPNGFTAAGLALNGSAAIAGNVLQLTNGGQNEAGSAFWATPVNIDEFTTNFNFQIIDPVADGFTFTIQNSAPSALGGPQAGLGYVGIHQSLAVKFDLYNNAGEGPNSTGVFTAGNIPAVPAIDLTGSGIDLHSGHIIHAQILNYFVFLNLTLTDTTTMASWTHTFVLDDPISTIIESNTAYIGFTGGTGSGTSTQTIQSWTYLLPPFPPNPE